MVEVPRKVSPSGKNVNDACTCMLLLTTRFPEPVDDILHHSWGENEIYGGMIVYK